MKQQGERRGHGVAKTGFGRFDRGERGDRRGEGAEQDRGKEEAAAAGERAAKEEPLDAAAQVPEVAQALAGFVEGERGPGPLGRTTLWRRLRAQS